MNFFAIKNKCFVKTTLPPNDFPFWASWLECVREMMRQITIFLRAKRFFETRFFLMSTFYCFLRSTPTAIWFNSIARAWVDGAIKSCQLVIPVSAFCLASPHCAQPHMSSSVILLSRSIKTRFWTLERQFDTTLCGIAVISGFIDDNCHYSTFVIIYKPNYNEFDACISSLFTSFIDDNYSRSWLRQSINNQPGILEREVKPDAAINHPGY